jgi:hypothetical protein
MSVMIVQTPTSFASKGMDFNSLYFAWTISSVVTCRQKKKEATTLGKSKKETMGKKRFSDFRDAPHENQIIPGRNKIVYTIDS